MTKIEVRPVYRVTVNGIYAYIQSNSDELEATKYAQSPARRDREPLPSLLLEEITAEALSAGHILVRREDEGARWHGNAIIAAVMSGRMGWDQFLNPNLSALIQATTLSSAFMDSTGPLGWFDIPLAHEQAEKVGFVVAFIQSELSDQLKKVRAHDMAEVVYLAGLVLPLDRCGIAWDRDAVLLALKVNV